jgi:3-hydroxyisobutyrate dehydrogenase
MAKTIKHVGYAGLGIMGSAMALNLLKTGFEVTVCNRTTGKCDPLRDAGAKVVDAPAALAQTGADVICINVTDTADVETVLFGDNGIAQNAKPGLIVIDNSTISPIATKNFAQRLKEKDVTLLDAPVSGGDVGARQGTLSIMVGGPPEVVQQCMVLFQAVGKNITHVGESGAGQLCKACNQIAVSCTLMGVVEALALAKAGGLELEKMIDVVKAGAGGSWQMTNLALKIAEGDFAPGFMIDLVLKDLAIVANNADKHDLDLAGVTQAQAYFKQAADQGGGRLGTQAMAKVFEGH